MVLAFVHLYTMFMIVPIFNSMMRIDRALIEAAERRRRDRLADAVERRSCRCRSTGIVIGSIFVITIVMGDFVTVGVMGGQQIASVGKIIQVQTSYLQFPLAAANAVILLARRADDHRGADPPRRHPQGAVSDEPRHGEQRSAGFWPLALVFALFVLFLYGPMITIFVLSFQGPEGGLTFPMRGVSLHWFHKLWRRPGRRRHRRGVPPLARLGAVVMVLTVVLSLLAASPSASASRAATLLFYVAVASLIMPSIIVSLGIGLQFRLLDDGVKCAARRRSARAARSRATAPRWACSPPASART